MPQVNINKGCLIFSTFRVYTSVNSVFVVRAQQYSVILRRMKL